MQTTDAPRLSKRAGFLVGVVSGLAMAVLMAALRFALGTQVIVEVMADWLTDLLPPSIFDYLLDALQFNAKRLLFGGIFAGQVVVAGGIGVAYARFAPRPPSLGASVQQATWMTAALFAALAAALTPAMGGGAFGSSLPDGATAYSLALLLSLAGFSLSITEFSGLMRSRGDLESVEYDAGRRVFMRWAGVFTAFVVVGGGSPSDRSSRTWETSRRSAPIGSRTNFLPPLRPMMSSTSSPSPPWSQTSWRRSGSCVSASRTIPSC